MIDRHRPPRPIEIVTEDDEISAWLSKLWPFGTAGPPFATSGTPMRILIRRIDTPFWSGLRDGTAAQGHMNTWHHRVDERSFWSWQSEDDRAPQPDASVVRLTLDDPEITIEVCGSPFRSWTALANAFFEAVQLAGTVSFHAAAIQRPATGGEPAQTWMVVGRSGSGKTTTMLRAVQAGWVPVAEDTCWLDPATLEIVGSDMTIGVRPPSQGVLHTALPSAASLSLNDRADPKVLVPWDDLGCQRHPRRLTHVTELCRVGVQAPGDRPSTRMQIAMALYEASGIPCTDLARTTLSSTIGLIAERTQPLMLGLGDIERPFP